MVVKDLNHSVLYCMFNLVYYIFREAINITQEIHNNAFNLDILSRRLCFGEGKNRV